MNVIACTSWSVEDRAHVVSARITEGTSVAEVWSVAHYLAARIIESCIADPDQVKVLAIRGPVVRILMRPDAAATPSYEVGRLRRLRGRIEDLIPRTVGG